MELDDDAPEGMRWLIGGDDDPRYLSPDGEPMELMEWCELFERRHADMSPESWWRKHTDISDEVRVSTVWLGLNHQYLPGGVPLFWETMVFGLDDDEYQWRYSTRAQAFDDHERIVKALRAGEKP